MVYLFYHIQNEQGESSSHPNATTLTGVPPGAKVTLQDVLNAFPLRGTGSFHFRFQVAQDGVVMFLDVLDPSEPVPMVGGNVIAKVLRLDSLKCTARQAFALQPRQASTAARSSDYFNQASPLPTGAAARPSENASVSSVVNRVASAVGFGPRFGSGASPVPDQQVQRPPVAAAAAANVPSPVASQPAPPQRRVTPSGDASPATASNNTPSPAAVPAAAAVIPMLKPVKAVDLPDAATMASIAPPAVVDDDLKDKSAYVQAKVMERRKKLEEEQKARIAEIEATEAAKAQEQNDRETARAMHAQRLKEWSEEATSGSKKDIRVLLSTLQAVLWPEAKWEPVTMGKLIEPRRVKATFLRACTLVHPDKQSGMDGVQKHLATQIFHILEAQFRLFQETNPM